MGVDASSRGLRYAIVTLSFLLAMVQIPLVALIALVSFVGGVQWPNQPPSGPSPWFIPFAALLVLNLVALVAFPMRSRTTGWWLLLTSQGADLLLVVIVLALTGPWPPYFVCLLCGTLTIGLLLALRLAQPRMT